MEKERNRKNEANDETAPAMHDMDAAVARKAEGIKGDGGAAKVRLLRSYRATSS